MTAHAARHPGERAPVALRGPDLRLLPAAVTAWVAAFWAVAAATVPVAVASVGALVLALGLVVGAAARPSAPWARRCAAVALAAATAGAVLAGAAAALAHRAGDPWAGWVRERAVARLDGAVTQDPRRLAAAPTGSGERYVLSVDLVAAQARGQRRQLDLPVVVLAPASWRELSAGQRITWTGRLATADPGDAAAAVVTALDAPRVRPGAWPWRLADRVRASLRKACAGLPPDPGGLLPSLVDGDGSRLPEPLRDDLTTAGLTHLTAVSGANLSIIAESALWVAAAARAPRPLRVALLVLTLAGFVVLARPSPSVLRAAAMGGVGVTATVLARRPRGVPALAAAVVVLLVVDPWLARSAGFALSAAATAGLLLLAPPWAAALARRMPRPLALALAAPAAAQIACGPVIVLLQPAVSLVAVPANLAAEPVVAASTVAGVVAAVVGTIAPGGAQVVATAGGLGTAWICLVAHRAAALPLAQVPWPPGLSGAVLLTAVEAVAVVASFGAARRAIVNRVLAVCSVSARRARTPWTASAAAGSGGPRGTVASGTPTRRAVLAGAAAVAAGGLGVLGLRLAGVRIPPSSGGLPADWTMAMADVGQGDATLLRSGRDRGVLVDTGPDPDLVDAALRRLGVRHLDLVVLTHFHADHVGGLAGALAGRSVGGILVSPLREPAQNVAAVQRLADAVGVPLVTAVPGQAGLAARDGWRVSWRVLTPSGSAPAVTAPETDVSDVVNESSVALVAELAGPSGETRAVLLGDLETQGQGALAQRLAAGVDRLGGPVDVVKVAHHGSAKQDEGLYRAIDARVGLIGVGAKNDYGHPAPSALAMMRRSGLAVLRTDLEGDLAVTVRSDGGLGLAASRAGSDLTRGTG